jgi:antitoxin YefM
LESAQVQHSDVDVRLNVRYNYFEVKTVKSINVTNARERLYLLIDEANCSHEPIQILGKRSNAVLISESDWNAIQETLYLLAIPGMRESILEGINTPVEECREELEW